MVLIFLLGNMNFEILGVGSQTIDPFTRSTTFSSYRVRESGSLCMMSDALLFPSQSDVFP